MVSNQVWVILTACTVPKTCWNALLPFLYIFRPYNFTIYSNVGLCVQSLTWFEETYRKLSFFKTSYHTITFLSLLKGWKGPNLFWYIIYGQWVLSIFWLFGFFSKPSKSMVNYTFQMQWNINALTISYNIISKKIEKLKINRFNLKTLIKEKFILKNKEK